MTFLNKSQEWNEDVYSLSGSVMDGVSEIHLKNFNINIYYNIIIILPYSGVASPKGVGGLEKLVCLSH